MNSRGCGGAGLGHLTPPAHHSTGLSGTYHWPGRCAHEPGDQSPLLEPLFQRGKSRGPWSITTGPAHSATPGCHPCLASPAENTAWEHVAGRRGGKGGWCPLLLGKFLGLGNLPAWLLNTHSTQQHNVYSSSGQKQSIQDCHADQMSTHGSRQ